MNFKLLSLIFSGITLAGGATAVAVIKNKNSSDQIRSSNTNDSEVNPPSDETRNHGGATVHLKPELENDQETHDLDSSKNSLGSIVSQDPQTSEARDQK